MKIYHQQMAYSSFIKTSQIEIASGVSLFEGPEKERSERPEFMRAGHLSVAFLKNAFFSHFFAIFIFLLKVKNTRWPWVPTPSRTAPRPLRKNILPRVCREFLGFGKNTKIVKSREISKGREKEFHEIAQGSGSVI